MDCHHLVVAVLYFAEVGPTDLGRDETDGYRCAGDVGARLAGDERLMVIFSD